MLKREAFSINFKHKRNNSIKDIKMNDNLNIENMNKIRLISKVAVQCDPRTLEKHKVVLELDWQSNADKTGYIAHIKDFKRVFIELRLISAGIWGL